jgi:hypothetical protein
MYYRGERLGADCGEIKECISLSIKLANDCDIVSSQHRQPKRLELHSIVRAKDALVRLLQHEVCRLIEPLQQALRNGSGGGGLVVVCKCWW